MNNRMIDPTISMNSFQQCIQNSSFEIAPVINYENLYSYADMPEPGERRLTYVRLDEDKKTVKAFLSCVPNGYVDGYMCVSVGYAVPEQYRGQGFAKGLLRDVVEDLLVHAKTNGAKGLAIEAVIDETNLASKKVAAAILKVSPEAIIDSISRKPAVRFTAKFMLSD